MPRQDFKVNQKTSTLIIRAWKWFCSFETRSKSNAYWFDPSNIIIKDDRCFRNQKSTIIENISFPACKWYETVRLLKVHKHISLCLNKIDFIYLVLASEVLPATSKRETGCAESNPWFIHENPADISKRKHNNCIYKSYLKFFFLLQS